jgi:hypothetical protein
MLGTVLFGGYIVMQKNPAVSCPFFWAFHSHCMPEVTEDFDVCLFSVCPSGINS